jgi:hypothetical protein
MILFRVLAKSGTPKKNGTWSGKKDISLFSNPLLSEILLSQIHDFLRSSSAFDWCCRLGKYCIPTFEIFKKLSIMFRINVVGANDSFIPGPLAIQEKAQVL